MAIILEVLIIVFALVFGYLVGLTVSDARWSQVCRAMNEAASVRQRIKLY